MKRIVSLFLSLLLLLSLLTGCAPAEVEEEVPSQQEGEQEQQQEQQEPEPDPLEAWLTETLSAMTLEEKVGQMFFVRCPERGGAEDVKTYHLGGYLLFGRDFEADDGSWLTAEQLEETLQSYQEASPIPLFIGVDEEGGTVVRASRNPKLFSQKRLSPQALYAIDGMDAILADTLSCNNTLLSYGINVNFAPVADVSTTPVDFIYLRSFGQDAEATADYVRQVVQQMNQCTGPQGEKIGSVLKHFPGYGNNGDTHTGVVVDRRPLEQFQQEDLLPFQAGIEAGASFVLVSHNVVNAMDPDLPASLSPQVHRILREELGFEGVILTDDLAMDAVEAYAQDGSVAVLAVLAGNDMIVTTDYAAQIPLVIQAVQQGEIPLEQIDTSVRRILSLKWQLGLIDTDTEA